jgi:hypothetical protein
MPSIANPRNKKRLPKFVEDFKANGAPEGERNKTLFKCACQYHHNLFTAEECWNELAPVAERIGLPYEEAVSAIGSAFSSDQWEPIGPQEARELNAKRAVRSGPSALPTGIAAVELPKPAEDMTPEVIRYLQAVFNEGDHVSIDTGKPSDSDKPRLSAGVTKTREEWVDHILDGNSFPDAIGVYVRVNPMKPGGSKAEDVADYRSTLVEFDDIPKGQQYALYLRSGLPIRTITDSGGDSLHAIVAIDAKDAEQYKQRVAIVTMSPWEDKDQKEDAFRCDVDWTVRDFPDVASIVVKKAFPLYEVDENAPDRSGKGKVEDILFFLDYGEMTSGNWEEKASEIGIKKTQFHELKNLAKREALLISPQAKRANGVCRSRVKSYLRSSPQCGPKSERFVCSLKEINKQTNKNEQ